jgi:hypothetical protein
LCIMNLLLKVRQLFSIFVWQFWDVCGMWCEESELKCGLLEAGFSIMIMCLLTECFQLANSWQNIQFLPFHNPPIYLNSTLSTFFYSINSKLPLKEEEFRTVEDINKATNDLKSIPQTSFEQCFQKFKRWWERFITM